MRWTFVSGCVEEDKDEQMSVVVGAPESKLTLVGSVAGALPSM